jgi:hypothetical protein
MNAYCPYGVRCQFKHGANDQFIKSGRKLSEEIETNNYFIAETIKCNVEQAKFSRTPRYSDILVRCLNASTQEQAKKAAIYEKKQDGKNQISEPAYQYMNIYQRAHKKLNVFSSIVLEQSDSDDEEHFGDAASYEKYVLKMKLEADFGYMSDPSPTIFKPSDFSTLSVSSVVFKPTI